MLPGKKYKPEDFLEMAWRRKWLIVVPFVLISIGTVIVVYLLPNKYRAETSLLVVPQSVSESYVRSTVTTKMEDRLRSISQQILSRARLERVIQDFNLYPEMRKRVTMEDAVERMRKDIDLQPIRGDAFVIAYVSNSPRIAKDIVERLASMFIEENLKDREVLAEGTDQFLEAQLDDARRRLIDHEKKLEAYRRQYSGELPSQLTSNLQVIQNTQMQVQSLSESLGRDRDRRLVLERAIADAQVPTKVPERAAPNSDEPLAVGSGPASEQLDSARKMLAALQTTLKAAHPDIVAMKRLIVELEKKAAAEGAAPVAVSSLTPEQLARQNRLRDLQTEIENVDREIARKQAEEQQLRGMSSEYQRRAEAAPARESDLVELMRDYTTLQEIYSKLLAKKEDSKIAANLERRQIGEQFKILDPARLPETPVSPQRARIDLLGALAGLGVGIGLAALMEYRDFSFRTEADVVLCLGLPVLAVVPCVVTSVERLVVARRRRMGALAAAVTLVVGIATIAWRLAPR